MCQAILIMAIIIEYINKERRVYSSTPVKDRIISYGMEQEFFLISFNFPQNVTEI